MQDIFVAVGAVAWMLCLLFFVFSAGVALLSFSFSYLLISSVLLAAVSGFMVVAGALKG